jgi:hypothetical protein
VSDDDAFWDAEDPGSADDGGLRAPRPRHRTLVVLLGSLVAAALIAGALTWVVRSVQSGIGGFFPQPGQTLSQFESAAEEINGVTSATDAAQHQVHLLTEYDVSAEIQADPSATDAKQSAIVDELGSEASSLSTPGVRVFAMVRFGAMSVGISPDAQLDAARLKACQTVAAMGGVSGVTCTWKPTSKAIVDDAKTQVVSVRTSEGAASIAALQGQVRAAITKILPDASVTVVAA